MTLKKPMPLILLMFTIMCAFPATTTAVIPSAIAQEDDDMSLDEAENLASSTVSNVLDNGNTAGDNTNTQLSVPLADQDQTDANFGLSETLDVTVERTLSPQEEEPPEFVAFCLVFTGPGGDPITGCFDTSDECEIAQDILVDLFPDTLISECDGFETLPPNAADCNIVEDQEGEPIGFNCVSQEI